MGTLLPENICADRKRAIEELIKGRARDTAAQLQVLFGNPTGDLRGPEEVVVELLTTFTDSVSALMMSNCQDCEVCQIRTQVGSPSSGDRRSMDSGESSKMPAGKERRGCYKRRKTSEMKVKVSTTSDQDGHAWRKYGQKEILNCQFPRCYFRCTHKHDQGCQATKQVQRIQDAPHMYRTTYFGHHTCIPSYPLNNNPSQNPLLHSDPLEPYVLHFESKAITTEKEHRHEYPSSAPSMKKECGDESTVQSNNLSGGDLPVAEPNVWQELMPLESSGVYSTASTSTSHGFDMDLLLESGDFGSNFHSFDDETEYLLGS